MHFVFKDRKLTPKDLVNLVEGFNKMKIKYSDYPHFTKYIYCLFGGVQCSGYFFECTIYKVI